MSRPGDLLRRLATRLCSERTRKRLVDPAVADLQAEAAAARRAGSAWRTLQVLAAGYLAIIKVLIVGASGEVGAVAATWAWVALGMIAVATVLLELPLLVSMSGGSGPAEHVRLATYLAPSTLALSVPLGLAVATAWILHGAARTRKVASVALVAAVIAFPVMFANLAWLTPDANQAFRARVMAHYQPAAPEPVPGDGELRLGELRQRLREAREGLGTTDLRSLETLYYKKWAISAAPLALVAVMVALGFRRSWSRVGLIGVAVALYAANYALWMSTYPLAQSGVAPPIVLEWAGNAICAAFAAVVTCWGSPRQPA